MFGRGTLRGLWALLVVAVLPILVSSIATAAPGYPVEDPPGATYSVAYEPSTQVLTLTDTTPEAETPSDAGVPGTADSASVEVEGPNGQVNHGQIIKHLHDLIEGNDRGCITSAVAQTDLGKGDQQVKPKDTAAASEIVDLDPAIVDIDCNGHGPPHEQSSNNADDKASNGRPDSPGKSDEAPGKNK